MQKEKDKLAELEESLGQEEKVLEGIRDSLKGKCMRRRQHLFVFLTNVHNHRQDASFP